MKNFALTLLSIMTGLLLVRYNPYISRKLLMEYVRSAYQAYQGRNLVNSNNAKNN
ncbi:MAG: hypothetical protein ABFD50_14575 [Smithella sp.]